MNPLPADQAYQLWYINEGDTAPKPGPTITVNEQGYGVADVASDTPNYDQLAVTVEPASGSQSPTLPIVLEGNLSGAAG
jgi:anti-sigma-K factor RskA